MASALVLRFIPFIVLTMLSYLHVWTLPSMWNNENEIIDSRGPIQMGQPNTTNIFGTSVTYIAPPFRNCKTLPIGVLSGYVTKRQAVRDTWGKNYCVYFMIGKKNGAWPQEEATQHSDVVLLDIDETYGGVNSSLPYKTALWFYLVHQHFPKAMHALKTDDDSFVKVNALQAELMRAQPDYWGQVHRDKKPIRDPDSKWYTPLSTWSDEAFPDFCSGAGYVLSRNALDCLVSYIKTPRITLGALEDVLIGLAMQTCGIEATHTALIDAFGDFGSSEPWLIKHYFF